MKKTYPVYVVLSLVVFALTIYIAGGSILVFLDAVSVMLIFIPMLLMLLSAYSPSEIIRSFRVAFQKSRATATELKNACLFFESAQSLIYKIAIAGTLFGVIIMLSSKFAIEEFALGFSVAILTVLYALFTAILVIIPFKTAVKKKLNSLE